MTRHTLALLALFAPGACGFCSTSTCDQCWDVSNTPAEEPCIYSTTYLACTTPDEGHYCSCSSASWSGKVDANKDCSGYVGYE